MNATPTIFVLSLSALSTTAAAQDLLHYKFDGGCGSTAINYAANSPAPAVGTIVTNLAGAPAASWTPGRFGQALTRGSTVAPQVHNYVDTGWVPGTITGSMTWACWIKMDPAAPTPSLTYVFGNGSTFRMFTGGGGFLLTASWGGGNVNTVANVQTLARAGWTHVACVIDGTAMTGQYYINGVPENPVTVTSQVNWTGANFYVGKYSGLTNASIFDLDEFILTNYAMSAAEVGVLAASPRGGDSAFGTGCGPTLAGNGQRPVAGNLTYGLEIAGPAIGPAALVFGTNRCTMFAGTVPLPVDLGLFHPQLTGCQGYQDADIGTLSTFVATNPTPIPFPLPNLPGLSGFTFYGQAIVFDAVANSLTSSNSISIGIGQ